MRGALRMAESQGEAFRPCGLWPGPDLLDAICGGTDDQPAQTDATEGQLLGRLNVGII